MLSQGGDLKQARSTRGAWFAIIDYVTFVRDNRWSEAMTGGCCRSECLGKQRKGGGGWGEGRGRDESVLGKGG